jgi:predicted CXXCH cytochrome family protein
VIGLLAGVARQAVAAGEQMGAAVILPAAKLTFDQLPFTQVTTPTQTLSDFACRLCHEDTTAVIPFPSGETLPAQVDLEVLDNSAHGVHGETRLECFDCHVPIERYQYPHDPVEEPDIRSFAIDRSQTCVRCHQDPHVSSHPGLDQETPVVCTDCHGDHDVITVEQWQAGEGTERCVDCHQQMDVPTQEPAELTEIIRAGLFADEVNATYCTACHMRDTELTFADGDTVSLQVTGEELRDSVHGEGNPWQPLDCAHCHDRYTYPHAPVSANSYRKYRLEKYTLCIECHDDKYNQTEDSVHAAALADGQEEAAVCTDCHGAHNTPPPDEPRERISLTCGQCHGTIFQEYADSVHGEALMEESNPDVATCIDCHGVHDIHDPDTALFRVRSPRLCAECHADEALMAEYDISTDVFETYVTDFHGTTVALFEQRDPDVETNKAVCYDCHGVHDIQPVEGPNPHIKENLLLVCQECHPDATANFPDAWTSHYVPSLEHNPGVFLVNWFYRLIIPGTVVFLAVLVGTDVFRRIRTRRSDS